MTCEDFIDSLDTASQMGFEEFYRLYGKGTLTPHQREIAAAVEDPMSKVILLR